MFDAASWMKAVCPDTEMGHAVLDFDWTSTPLGAPEAWPIEFRTVVGICMTSSFPILLTSGPELTAIYNDAYRALLGDKHPAALGAPIGRAWAESWADVGPLFDRVLTTGQAVYESDLLLLAERHGFPEESHFIVSYSPLFDVPGEVSGVLVVVTEITDQVLDRRRMEIGAHLAAALQGVEDLTEVCIRAAAVLDRARPDVMGADILLEIDGRLTPVISTRGSTVPGPTRDELERLEVNGVHVVGDTSGDTGPAERVLMAMGSPDRVRGMLVVETNPHCALGPIYREFLQLLANTIDTSLQVAYRHATEIGRYRHVSDTLQAALLEPADDLPTVAARYVPASGNLSVGGDWYDVIELGPDCRALVVGDCVGHGLDAARAMSQLRSVARAGLLEGRDPAAVLDSLDVYAERTEHAAYATAAIVMIDRGSGEITLSRAGHIPPLIVGSETSTWLEGGGSIPLGTQFPAERENATYTLHEGELLVLCSDGLVERRGESLETGLARLETTIRNAGSTEPQQVADHLVRTLIPDRPDDDVVLIVKCIEFDT